LNVNIRITTRARTRICNVFIQTNFVFYFRSLWCLIFLYFISSDIGNFSSNFNFWPLRCMAGFGLFELGLELAALGPLFLLLPSLLFIFQ
jgi:hypothetical protein